MNALERRRQAAMEKLMAIGTHGAVSSVRNGFRLPEIAEACLPCPAQAGIFRT